MSKRDTLGGAIAYIRRSLDLTRAELAALMSAQGVAWRREQVLRVEAGQRELGAHEALWWRTCWEWTW